ncbi:MAG TPA: agmatinase [Candidatus Monoglobus merdigallinarum]|uniref:Agmatinase n=1 Tax=Candidatus Monoglobus merdigallinarum TaxID=2838698 RepID=A0A9D1TLX1_9FIRM|nr:agmatinase [Candidatus Monoglobus merdigallinarum]
MSDINYTAASPCFIGCDCEFADAEICVFGAPFDSTTSFRPGTRFAAQAMRPDSWGLETYSPYQDKDMSGCRIFDAGDLELSVGDTEAALKQIEEFSAGILKSGKVPVMIGGEHLVTLGAVRAAYEKYGDELRIIHFDAHTDLRDELLGVRLSHATVIRRCTELLGDGKIYQFGIRSGERYEFEWGETHNFMHRFDLNGLSRAVEALKGRPVYFTVDLDVLDPSVFPGTGTPEPGGVGYTELQSAVTRVCADLDIVGSDIVELSPHYDQSGVSTAVACKILREMLLAISK